MSDRNRTGISDQFNITQQPQPADSGESSTSNQQWCAWQQPRPLERGGESSTSNQQMHGWQQPQPLEGSGGTSTSNQQRHARQQPRPLERGGESSTSNQQMHALQQPQPLERGGNSSSNQQIYTQLTTGTKRTENPNEVTDTRQPPQHRQRLSMHGSGSGTNSRYVVDNENIADQQGTEETRRPVFQGHENENCDCQLNESIDNTAAHESHPEASHIFQQAPNQPTYHQAGIQSNVRPLQYYPSPLVIQYLIQLQNLSLIFRPNFTSTSLQPAHHANQHPNPGTVNNITSTSRQPGPHDFQGHQDEYHVRQEINPLPGSNFESSSRDPSSHSSQGPQYICIYCHQGTSAPHIALTHEGRYCGHLCHPHCFNSLPVEVQQSNETCPECWRRPPHLNTH